MENACSSALQGIESAMQSIHAGECNACVVACVNMCIDPKINLGLMRYNMLSPDGACKAYDKDGMLTF